jgi:hypothetical protein
MPGNFYLRYFDADGVVVADWLIDLYAFLTPGGSFNYFKPEVTCGTHDDPTATKYESNPQAPECEPWRAAVFFPFYSPCQTGTCS